jgi:hypothetical protein
MMFFKKSKVGGFVTRLKSKELDKITISLAEFNRKAIETKLDFLERRKKNPKLTDEFVMRIVEQQLAEFKGLLKGAKKARKKGLGFRGDSDVVSKELEALFERLNKFTLDYDIVLNGQYSDLIHNRYEELSKGVEKEKELSQLAGLEAENLREQLINLEKIAKQRSGLQREQAMMLAKNLIYGLSSLSLMAAVGGFYVLKFGIKSGGILTMVGILAGVVYALFASGYWMLLVGAVLVTSPLWGMIVILGLK